MRCYILYYYIIIIHILLLYIILYIILHILLYYTYTILFSYSSSSSPIPLLISSIPSLPFLYSPPNLLSSLSSSDLFFLFQSLLFYFLILFRSISLFPTILYLSVLGYTYLYLFQYFSSFTEQSDPACFELVDG